MFTVCPKCALTLVVTAADLRVAQGYVRCGRCLNVFNALARLSEERPAAGETPPDATTDGPTEQAVSPEPPAPPSTADDTGEIEIELELDASVLANSVHPTAAPERAAEPEGQSLAPDSAAAVPAAKPAAAAITPTSPAAAAAVAARAQPISATPVPVEPVAASARRPLSPAIASAPAPEDPLRKDPPAQLTAGPSAVSERSEAAPSAEASEAQQTNTSEQEPESAFELAARRPRAGLAWQLGAGALVVALALQVVNHYRDSLAANPALIGPLRAVYSALGVKLAPRWNIHAYDVRQLGASVASAAAGEIVVRASVKNSASRAQPLPLLRVTLQDRFGNRIAARDVPPGDYLPSSVAPSSLLAAGGRVDATMTFVDPGPQAVGFEIDACLRQRSGEVACAHGP